MTDRILFASLPALFSLTLFISAGLLFLVELMIAKMILPLFGGTPAVWNTCMMFFQATLLAGYGYAHFSGTKAELNRQIMIHLAILLAACALLPIAIPRHWMPASEGNPAGMILLLLVISVGLPFFIISATAPLLQKWFARTGHPQAGDPYFLYSASNLGSMIALIGYPLWIEPGFRLVEQGRGWAIGYGFVLVLTALCAAATRRLAAACPPGAGLGETERTGSCAADGTPLGSREQGRWVLLAFVPSSMMLGVTTFLSTDVAAFPLFWVVPLSLYLLSFIIVFARVPGWILRMMVPLQPVALAALIFANFSEIGIPKWVIFIAHLVHFFICCMVCHGEIVRTRPATAHLTKFYLWISVGGVLGGIFNSLLAPLLFSTVFEYPLILVLALLLLPAGNRDRSPSPEYGWGLLGYLALPALLVPLTYRLMVSGNVGSLDLPWLTDPFHFTSRTFLIAISYGALALFCGGLVFLKRPFLFGLGIAAVLLTAVLGEDAKREIVHRERSFFGVMTVTRDADGRFMYLSHGTTLHGMQWLNPVNRLEPVAYYHQKGPAGEVFAEFSGAKAKARIAVTGLGTGTLAAYAEAGQQIDFYEIDPAVSRIATDPAYFSFLSECKAEWRVILGDARLTMERAPPHSYGMIVMDAFSSDAIPLHLLTREAIRLYFSKLANDGILLIHISNKYVNLAPVLAVLANEGGLKARIREDDGDDEIGKYGTTWVLLARKEADFGGLARNDDWKEIALPPNVRVWTDDFSNILSVFKW